MSKEYEEFIPAPGMSIEEFDHITDGVEDHVFSAEYNARKESIMKKTNRTRAKTSHLGIKIAGAAAALVIATPFVANAATNGELFARIWGKDGKKDIPSHKEVVVEEGKVDKNGKTSTYEVDYPRIEYQDTDAKKAEELLEGKFISDPKTVEIGGYKFTVNGYVSDGITAVVDYTIEKKGGVDLLNYSQIDNEAKGAFANEDQPVHFSFPWTRGKLYVNLEKSTKDKLYCTEYLQMREGFTGLNLEITEYTDSLNNLHAQQVNPNDHIKDQKIINLPGSGDLSLKNFESANGEKISISPISMKIGNLNGKPEDYVDGGFDLDLIGTIKIIYKDGSEYLVMQDIIHDGKHDDDKVDEVASYAYICGGMDCAAMVNFNRLVDTGNIAKIMINDTEYIAK